jgi:hypothetical protein
MVYLKKHACNVTTEEKLTDKTRSSRSLDPENTMLNERDEIK